MIKATNVNAMTGFHVICSTNLDLELSSPDLPLQTDQQQHHETQGDLQKYKQFLTLKRIVNLQDVAMHACSCLPHSSAQWPYTTPSMQSGLTEQCAAQTVQHLSVRRQGLKEAVSSLSRP